MDDSYVYCKYHETALEQQAGRITLMHGVSVRLVKLEGTLQRVLDTSEQSFW
jgi:hypothetical protein